MRANTILASVGFLLACVSPGWAWTIPSTGITACYDMTGGIDCPSPGQAYYGQNGNYPGRTHAFQDGGDVVTDLITKLVWQKTPDGALRSWDDAAAYCEGLELDGQTGWRLPFQRELVTIIDHAASKPALYPAFGGENGKYWSATPYLGYEGAAWYVNFAYGVSEFQGTQETYITRCVRGQALAESSFTVTSNRVTDATTGLVWERTPSAAGMTWPEALAYCEAQTTDGFSDWRLPNVMELRTIVDYTRFMPAIDTAVFEETGEIHWTGSTCANVPVVAWGVDFSTGFSANNDKTSDGLHVRCVRGGEASLRPAATDLLLLQ